MELLLTVDQHFLIKGRGLTVLPLIDYPTDFLYKPFLDQVVVRPPEKDEITFTAKFNLEHHTGHYPNGEIWDADYIVLQLPEGTKELVPVGTQVFVTQELLHYIKGEIHTDTHSISWLEPWSEIEDPKICWDIERELYREIGKGHSLFMQPMRAIGRSQDKDNFLFEFGLSSRLAVVHLTYSWISKRPPYPITYLYNDITEFVEKRMKPDHDAFTGTM
jgi:hypothetical protein